MPELVHGFGKGTAAVAALCVSCGWRRARLWGGLGQLRTSVCGEWWSSEQLKRNYPQAAYAAFCVSGASRARLWGGLGRLPRLGLGPSWG